MNPEFFCPFRPQPVPRSQRITRSLNRVLRTRIVPAALAAAAGFLAVGCGEEEPAGPEHRHQVSQIFLAPVSLTLAKGTQAQLLVTGQCSCGSPMDVGAVWETSNAQVATISSTGVVSAVGPGTATITAKAAMGTGWLSTTATVTVTGLPPGASFELGTILPPAFYSGGWLTLMRSTNQRFKVRITRTAGFTGTVALEAQAVPSGIIVSFSPAATDGDVVEATVAAGESALNGEYQITLRGLADGLASRTLQVPVNVVGPEGDDFVLSATPDTITVTRGTSATTTIVVTRTAAFANGFVGLGAWYAPPGMTAEFSPQRGDQFTTSALTLRAAESVAAGTYDVLVWGAFDIYGDVRWTHVHVRVIEPPGVSFELGTILPPSPYIGGGLTLMRSTQQGFKVRITRTAGFTGTVTLEAQAVPGGITVSFSPAATDGNMVEATVAAGESALYGEYQITLRGLADGLASRSVQVPLILVGPEGEDFVLSADPDTITVTRGASATTTIVVTRTAAFANGFVGLGAWYAPPGMTVEFSPQRGDQFTTSALTLRAAESLAAGTYDVLVWGVFDTYGDVRWTHVHVRVVNPPGAS